jgi:hypothetical protein
VPRHGVAVRGALTVPGADAGGRLQVELRGAGSVLLARLSERGLAAGPLRFTIVAGRHALRTLRRNRRLRLTITVRLAPATGAGASASRRLTLRR